MTAPTPNASDAIIAEARARANEEGRPMYVVEESGRLIATRHRNPNDIVLFIAEPNAPTAAETRRGIYIASRTRHAEQWRALRDEGCPIVSSWIDEAGVGETVDWRDLWDRCIAEAANAAALIVYAEQADTYLKGALVEVGAALSHGVPVYLVAADRNIAGSAWNHRLVTECDSFEDALALAIAAGLSR